MAVNFQFQNPWAKHIYIIENLNFDDTSVSIFGVTFLWIMPAVLNLVEGRGAFGKYWGGGVNSAF
jgi:hypothetical protein